MSLDKLMRLAGPPAPEEDPAGLMVLSARLAVAEVLAYLAGGDDSGDSKGGDDKKDGDHTGHATYKAMIKRKVDPKKAAAMCAKADNRVSATRAAESAMVSLSALAAPDYPGAAEAAREMALTAVPGRAADPGRIAAAELMGLSAVFACPEDAAEFAALAAKAMGDGGVIMNHGAFTGTHSHSHFQSAVHGHPHQHFGDNTHDGGPQHRPGSKPGTGQRAGW